MKFGQLFANAFLKGNPCFHIGPKLFGVNYKSIWIAVRALLFVNVGIAGLVVLTFIAGIKKGHFRDLI